MIFFFFFFWYQQFDFKSGGVYKRWGIYYEQEVLETSSTFVIKLTIPDVLHLSKTGDELSTGLCLCQMLSKKNEAHDQENVIYLQSDKIKQCLFIYLFVCLFLPFPYFFIVFLETWVFFKGVWTQIFLKHIECCNFQTISVMYIKVYISGMEMSQRIYFWYQMLLKC